MAKSWSRLLSWQCHLYLIRPLAILLMIGAWVYNAHSIRILIPSSEVSSNVRFWIAQWSGALGFGGILVLNDIFILTLDFKRTNSLLGCLVTQAVANGCATSLTIVFLVAYERQWELFISKYTLLHRWYAVLGISALLAGLCSLGLLGVGLWSMVLLRPYVPIEQIWKMNTKDALRGTPLPTTIRTLSLLGDPRETVISFSEALGGVIRLVKRFLARLLFRRVRPVETRVYAFARNSFAVVAMGMLTFRAVTALQNAQNEIETRVTSTACEEYPSRHRLTILSDRLIYDTRWGASLPQNVTITVGMVWNDPSKGYESYNKTDCTMMWSKPFNNSLGYYLYQSRVIELFECPWLHDPLFDTIGMQFTQRDMSDTFAYSIQVHPAAGIPGGKIYESQMPRIWLANQNEFPKSADNNQTDLGEVRAYLPPFTLVHNSAIVAEANLITRRLIQSSIIKDIIFSLKSDYRVLSMYPIVETSITALNSSSVNIAAATIRPSLKPGIMYHRKQTSVWDSNGSLKDICDYIEDYRSGTILDVIGSVGGLFAILQAAHLLLFGRPLFWGLTGAKTITPFGLFGGFNSREFRRRLREEYYTKSDEDGTDKIRIDKFLRDFVIDLGPADPHLKIAPRMDNTRPSSALTVDEEDVAGLHVPLVHMNSDMTGARRTDDEGGEVSNRTEGRDNVPNIV